MTATTKAPVYAITGSTNVLFGIYGSLDAAADAATQKGTVVEIRTARRTEGSTLPRVWHCYATPEAVETVKPAMFILEVVPDQPLPNCTIHPCFLEVCEWHQVEHEGYDPTFGGTRCTEARQPDGATT